MASGWDVIIIGAGPAGGLSAVLLARQGVRVLLVERRAFPRPKVCGACLNGRAMAVLRGAGLQERLEQLPGVDLSRVTFRTGRRTLTLPVPGGRAIARHRMDEELVHAAVEAGAEFLPETVATVLPDIEANAPARRVLLATGSQPPREEQASLVLAADGLAQSSLQRLPELTTQVASGARIGAGTTVTAFPDSYAPGTIYLAVHRFGYVGLVRTDDGELNIAQAVDGEFLRRAGGPAAAAGMFLSSAGCEPIPALAAAHWHGTIPLTRRPSAVAGHRLFLLGDSTGYVEPFTGEGMAWALAAAARVTPLVQRGLQDWDAALETEWTNDCRREIGRRQRWCRILSTVIRIPWASLPLMSLLGWFPRLAAPVVRQIHGSAAYGKPA